MGDPWGCPTCRHVLAPQFTECWQCGYVRGTGGNESIDGLGPDPMNCPRCDLELEFVGTKRFHEGSRAAPFVLAELGELFVHRESFDVYVCPRCGRVELFLDGTGEEFRER